MRILAVTFVLLISLDCFGQRWQYSQFEFTRQRINPSAFAHTPYASAMVNYRNQQTGGDFAINSNFLGLSYPLMGGRKSIPWAAIGLNFHRDHAGGIFLVDEAGLSYAVNIALAERQTLSFGAQGVYQTRRIDYSGFVTGAQYVANRGFNPAISNGEASTTLSSSVTTFSTGLQWHTTDERNLQKYAIGIALFDFNKPSDSFFSDNSITVPPTATLHALWQWWEHKVFHVYSDVLASMTNGKTTVNAGVRVQKILDPLRKKSADRVEMLMRYVPGRSGIIGMQPHRELFSMGVSYDFPLLTRNPANVGALEVALEIRTLVKPKRKAKRYKKKAKGNEQASQVDKQKVRINRRKPATTDADSIQLVEVVQDSLPMNVSTPRMKTRLGNLTQEVTVVETRELHFYFAFNSTELDQEARQYLEQVAHELTSDPSLKLFVEGFTDNVGRSTFNQLLSERRAQSVCDYLRELGITEERLHSMGRGEQQPLNANSTEEERALNRRVQLTFFRD